MHALRHLGLDVLLTFLRDGGFGSCGRFSASWFDSGHVIVMSLYEGLGLVSVYSAMLGPLWYMLYVSHLVLLV